MSDRASRHAFDEPDFAAARWQDHPAVRAARVVLLALLGFAFSFVELVAEIAATFLLFAGAVWWVALKVLSGLADPDLAHVLRYFPVRIVMDGWVLTPGELIRQGVLLLAIVAGCHMLNRLIDRNL